ncbi:Transcriptional repressor OPI1 [Nakaseomyces bracarensis]|uniref:Transcriptional repressor OPI1 n=1 Tax=Nakaseomyces bracarensis TaxID=273131 RepID=A0ABR4NN62_9SACH
MEPRRGWIHNYISFSGLSQEDVEAAEALDVLRNSAVFSRLDRDRDLHRKRNRQDDDDGSENDEVVQSEDKETTYTRRRRKASVRERADSKMSQDSGGANITATTEESLFDRVCRNSNQILTNMGSFFEEMNNNEFTDDEGEEEDADQDDEYSKKKRKYPGVLGNALSQDHELDEIKREDDDSIRSRTWGTRSYSGNGQYYSKRQILSEAIAKGADNLKEYKLNMSIESKKRLITCLHLLKLANNQLAEKVASLQDVVEKEQEEMTNPGASGIKSEEHGHDEDQEFYDAAESVDERSGELGLEIVGTVKKVYSLISKYTGNSLPEPARSQVRESLLNLPTNWNTSIHNGITYNGHGTLSATTSNTSDSSVVSTTSYPSIIPVSSNGKYLILAKESLNMVQSVIDVVDSTLGKAEEWVKQKQELKEMIRQKFLEQQNRRELEETQTIKHDPEEERSIKVEKDIIT